MASTHFTPWICCVNYWLSLENVIQPPQERLLTYFTICEWNSTVSSLRSSAPCASPASARGCTSTALNFHKCFMQRSTTLHLFQQVCPVLQGQQPLACCMLATLTQWKQRKMTFLL